MTFPPYPTVAELPDDLTEDEEREFALKLIAEQGAALGDYLYAAIRQASDHKVIMRWVRMSDLVQSLHEGPIHLTYRACERIEAERWEGEA